VPQTRMLGALTPGPSPTTSGDASYCRDERLPACRKPYGLHIALPKMTFQLPARLSILGGLRALDGAGQLGESPQPSGRRRYSPGDGRGGVLIILSQEALPASKRSGS